MTSSVLQSYPSLADRSSPAPVEWLWPGWLPRGRLTILGGLSGVGKSFVALDLARRIIEGLPFPDGARTPTLKPDKIPCRMPGQLPPGLVTVGLTQQNRQGSTASSERETVVYVDGWTAWTARCSGCITSRLAGCSIQMGCTA